MNRLITRIPIWNMGLAVYSDCTSKQAAKDLSINFENGKGLGAMLKKADGEAHFVMADGVMAIWVSYPLDNNKGVALLAHEALHATIGILVARGVDLTNASEETTAYTLQYIIHEVLENVRPYNRS